MPDVRALVIAIGVGVGVATYAIVWWHWPIAIGAGAGFLLGGLALTGAISVRADGSAADEAWREAAPDLVDGPASPSPGVLPQAPTASAPAVAAPVAAAPDRGRDRPSGD